MTRQILAWQTIDKIYAENGCIAYIINCLKKNLDNQKRRLNSQSSFFTLFNINFAIFLYNLTSNNEINSK